MSDSGVSPTDLDFDELSGEFLFFLVTGVEVLSISAGLLLASVVLVGKADSLGPLDSLDLIGLSSFSFLAGVFSEASVVGELSGADDFFNTVLPAEMT